MWTFFPAEQICVPCMEVSQRRGSSVTSVCTETLKKFVLTVADDPSYLLRANLLWSLLIGVSSPISFSRAVF